MLAATRLGGDGMTLVIDHTIVNHEEGAYNWSFDQDPDVVVTGGTYLGGYSFGFNGNYSTSVRNHGYIYGRYEGVITKDAVNYGTIRSNITAVDFSNLVDNYGDIEGGIYSSFDYDKGVFNHGNISGRVGVYFLSAPNMIVNDATISSTDTGDLPKAIEIDELFRASCHIVNNGTINGSIVLPGYRNDEFASLSIRNSGTINGSLELSNKGTGQITYYGRNGTLSGSITFGYGKGVAYAGVGGGTILTSGEGLDYIYCGTGADTVGLDATNSSNRLTYISGFDSSNDTIELNHMNQPELVAGQRPAFTYADAATSTDDHLFLNPSTNLLYYDADGNGSGSAYAMAHVAPGTHLTASNFKVV